MSAKRREQGRFGVCGVFAEDRLEMLRLRPAQLRAMLGQDGTGIKDLKFEEQYKGI